MKNGGSAEMGEKQRGQWWAYTVTSGVRMGKTQKPTRKRHVPVNAGAYGRGWL